MSRVSVPAGHSMMVTVAVRESALYTVGEVSGAPKLKTEIAAATLPGSRSLSKLTMERGHTARGVRGDLDDVRAGGLVVERGRRPL